MIKISFSFILFALLAMSGCTEKTPPIQQPPLKITLNTWPGYAYAFVAEKKGFFAKHGVRVQLILHPEYLNSLRTYENEEADGLFAVFADIVMFNAKGFPTTVVYGADYSETADLIIGRPEFSELRELKGKTVAFEGFNTFSHLFVVAMLEQVGIREGEFKAVNLESSRILTAFKSGEIDAGHIYEPHSSQAIAKGFKVLAKAGDIPNIIADVLAFRQDIVENRSEEVQKVIHALVESRKFIDAHPQEAFNIMAQAENLSSEEMELGFRKLHVLNVTENFAALKPGGTLFTIGQKIIDFYGQRGQLQQKPSLDAMINGQFVFTVKETQP